LSVKRFVFIFFLALLKQIAYIIYIIIPKQAAKNVVEVAGTALGNIMGIKPTEESSAGL
jgi:hypothetical protein